MSDEINFNEQQILKEQSQQKIKKQKKTKYSGVYVDNNGKFFYQTEFGLDKITGKRIRRKGRKDKNGIDFKSASEANKELTRIKREYYEANGFSNYHMNYKQFMTNHYIPYYRTTVQDSTYLVREKSLLLISERFGNTKLRSISIEQVQSFRT